MILDTNVKLQIVLAGNVTTSQLEYHVHFRDRNREGKPAEPGLSRGATNNTTDVTMLDAPGTNNPRREIEGISVYNKDSVSATAILKTDDGTTERIINQITLATLETLYYDGNGGGWYATTVAGARK